MLLIYCLNHNAFVSVYSVSDNFPGYSFQRLKCSPCCPVSVIEMMFIGWQNIQENCPITEGFIEFIYDVYQDPQAVKGC